MSNRKYHGWVVLVDQGPGMNEKVHVEYRNARGARDSKDMGYGNRGCIAAVEWWDKRLNQPVKLEPTLKGCYRVYTEEVGDA